MQLYKTVYVSCLCFVLSLLSAPSVFAQNPSLKQLIPYFERATYENPYYLENFQDALKEKHPGQVIGTIKIQSYKIIQNDFDMQEGRAEFALFNHEGQNILGQGRTLTCTFYFSISGDNAILAISRDPRLERAYGYAMNNFLVVVDLEDLQITK